MAVFVNSRVAISSVVVAASVFILNGCNKATESGPAKTSAPAAAPTSPGVAKAANADEIGKVINETKQGGIAVINFWATWCPPCVKETPALVNFYRDFKDDGVRFLSISADDPATIADKVTPFIAEHNLPYDVYVLNGAMPDQLSPALGAEASGALPETFLFDRNGKLVTSWLGEVTQEDLAKAVVPLLRIPAT